MKFLFFGDKHERATAPENRIGDFLSDSAEKTKEIIELGKIHKVSAFLQPGDFWESPNPPLDYASKVMKQWTNVDIYETLANLMSGTEEDIKNAVSTFRKDYIPMIGVVGNHELVAGNINTLPRTMAGFMNQLGLTKFATKENPIIFETEDNLKIAITGTHYHLGMDYPINIDDYIVEEKLGDYHIHIVHGMLSEKDMGTMIRHTLIDNIKHTKADLTISGHDHIGFPITEIDGKYFANPGAVIRLKNDLKEISRQPKVLLIEITKDNGLTLKEIPLQSAKKGETVLNRKKIEEQKEKEERLEAFKAVVRKAELEKSTDIVEIVRNISENKKLEDKIKESISDRLTNKMPTKESSLNNVEQVYVEKMILENFQCHEYTELDFDKGFNLLIGESSQGKSAVLRGLQWVYENKPRGKRIVRRGADYAKVTLFLSNKYIVERYLEIKSGGKNGYYITDPSGDRNFNNTKAIEDVQTVLGFHNLIIDKDLEVNLNFMKQGSGWFLIGDHVSAPSRAKIIGGIYGTQYADAVVRDLEKEDRILKDKTKAANNNIEKIEKQLEEFSHLEDLEKSIKFVEQLISKIEVLKNRKSEIVSTLKKREEFLSSLEEQAFIIETLKDISKNEKAVLSVKNLVDRKTQIEKQLVKHSDSQSKLNNVNESILKTDEIENSRTNLEKLNKLIDKRDNLYKLLVNRFSVEKNLSEQFSILDITSKIENANDKIKSISNSVQVKKDLEKKIEYATKLETKKENSTKSLNAINLTIKETSSIKESRDGYNKILESITRKESINALLGKYEIANNNMKKESKIIEDSLKRIDENIDSYKKMLEKAGKCPVCFGTIDKATVNRIVAEYKPIERGI